MTTTEEDDIHYVVATIKPWNIDAYHRTTAKLPGLWHLISKRESLTGRALAAIAPRYVFFPHWSWPVPAQVFDGFECVCFHMTDVPYGRGGSPLQNLITRGATSTVMTALRMVEEIDAGPVYLQRPLDLSGRAQDIYERAADLVFDMIGEIVEREPHPVPQRGEPTCFGRRTPAQSNLPADATPRELYDHIRMLDADTYPRAFIHHGNLRLEFSDAHLDGAELSARVVITVGEATRSKDTSDVG